MKKRTLTLLTAFLLFAAATHAKTTAFIGGATEAVNDTLSPLPNGGVTTEWCDIASSGDFDGDEIKPQTLRDRIAIYNEGDDCRFYLYFLFRNQTIRIAEPLVLEKNLHDRDPSPTREVLTGTYLSGYGPGGVTDKLGITIDAEKATEDAGQCAFLLKGGFSAKQQIHGITIIARSQRQAICDENGNDLLFAASPNFIDHRLGKDGDFKDVTVFLSDPDDDNDGITDEADQCPGTEDDIHVNSVGCPDKDQDGLADADDHCPDVFGPAANEGCKEATTPDPDGDGNDDPDGDGTTPPPTNNDQTPPPPAAAVTSQGCGLQLMPVATTNVSQAGPVITWLLSSGALLGLRFWKKRK